MEITETPLNPSLRLPQPGSEITSTSRTQDSRFLQYALIGIQLLFFFLLLWRLPRVEALTVAPSNLVRIPFLALMGGILLLMIKSKPVDALGIFVGAIAFEPAIQAEQWMPQKYLLLIILTGSIILYLKSKPVQFGLYWIICMMCAGIYLLNAFLGSGLNTPVFAWGMHIMAGAFLCGFCQHLKPSPIDTKWLSGVSGTSITLLALLSVASARHNDKLPLSVNELLATQFRLGQVDMESFNTFACLCALGVFNWIVYLQLRGNRLVGITGALICSAAMIASKTISVLAILILLLPIVLWQMTADRRLIRILSLTGWTVACAGVLLLLTSDLDLLSIQSRDKETGSGRLIIWNWAVSTIVEEPFGLTWSEYAASAPIEQRYVNLQGEEYEPVLSPHNSILTSFIFGGIPAGTLFTLLVAQWLKRSYGLVKSGGATSLIRCLGPFTLLAHMTMDFWYFNFFLGIMWVYFSNRITSTARTIGTT